MDALNDIVDKEGPTVHLPDLSTITSTKSGCLPISTHLNKKSQKVAVLNNLKSASLISFGQLCDDDCDVLLRKKNCYVLKNNNIIMQGSRNKHDNLWDIKLPRKQPTSI
jgi:hypothetical protein